MRRTAIVGYLMSLLLVLLVGCRDRELVREMVSLDKALISSLNLTAGNGDKGAAVMSFKEFKVQWSTFKLRYATHYEGDSEWEEAFERIDDRVQSADGHVNVGNMNGAHMAIEGIRFTFIDLRKKYGIEYFLDRFVEFQSVMEPVFESAEDNSLSPAEMDLIDRTFPDVLTLWERVRTAKFDRRLFGFSEAKSKKLRTHFDEISSALSTLHSAMGRNDRSAMLEAVRRIQPHFSKSMEMFGQDSFI